MSIVQKYSYQVCHIVVHSGAHHCSRRIAVEEAAEKLVVISLKPSVYAYLRVSVWTLRRRGMISVARLWRRWSVILRSAKS